jgi:hypothetical protein
MDSGGFSWGLITIVGPILLLIVLAWAVLRNRRSKTRKDVTEAGTRRVYEEEERRRRTGRDGAP